MNLSLEEKLDQPKL